MGYFGKLDDYPLAKAAIIDVLIQWFACVISYLLVTEKIYDLIGSSTFLYITWMTYSYGRGCQTSVQPRQIVQSVCVTLWALRLGSYLFTRVLKSGEDRRFRKAKKSLPIFLIYWTFQAAWVWITLSPTMILNTKDNDKSIGALDYIGWIIWLVGLSFETIADYQKDQFRKNPDNRGKFINVGVWSISRHPNYFGEILVWVGLCLPPASVMKGGEFASLASPLFVMFLLIFVSGIPMLEKYADNKWGESDDYQQYKKKTAKLVPFIW